MHGTRTRSLIFTLVCAALLGLAPSARAGFNAIENPGDIASCGSLDVAANMQDPNATTSFSFAGPEGCAKLCKQSEKECKDFVKRVSSCRMRFNGNQEAYDKKSCDVNFQGSDVKTCKKSVTQDNKDADSNEKVTRDLQLNACEAWRAICATRCSL
jgi:hypothetical protein